MASEPSHRHGGNIPFKSNALRKRQLSFPEDTTMPPASCDDARRFRHAGRGLWSEIVV
jgi:hypothetical protein